MKKILLGLALLLTAGAVGYAQTTVVSGQVLDPSNNPYRNAVVTVDFINNSSLIAKWNNFPLTVTTWTTSADSNGNFSQALPDLNFIAPATGTFYNFRVCANFSVPPGQPTNPCFTYSSPSCPNVGCITGSTITITAALQSVSVAVPNSALTSVVTNPNGAQTISGQVLHLNGGTTTNTLNSICMLDGTQTLTLAAAITCAGSSGIIEIPPSAGTVTVPSNATIPAGVELFVDEGATLNIATAVTLTINGPIFAGPFQWLTYTGTGTALINNSWQPVYFQWFPGAEPGAQTASAFAALGGRGTVWITQPAYGTPLVFTTDPFAARTNADRLTVMFGPGIFQTSAGFHIVENTVLYGQGPRVTTLQATGNVWVVQYNSASAAAQSVHVEHMTIDGNSQSGSGCVLYQNSDLPSTVEDVICQSWGSLGGLNFTQANSFAYGAGGSARNVWAIGNTSGVAGGTSGAGPAWTFDTMGHFLCYKCFAQYNPSGVVVKNTGNTASLGLIFTDLEFEGIAVNTGSTGVGLDLQANVNGVEVFGVKWFGPSSGAGTFMKTAATANNWDIHDLVHNTTNTTTFNINGTTYTPTNTYVHRFTDNLIENNAGLEIYAPGNTVPVDVTSPLEAFSNVTNCVLTGTTTGVVTFALQCGGKASFTIAPNANGSVPTLTGTGACATFSTQVGGSWAGTFKCTGTSGAATITLTPGQTATNSWGCDFKDLTTVADTITTTISGTPTTTCTASAAAIASGDVIKFGATQF